MKIKILLSPTLLLIFSLCSCDDANLVAEARRSKMQYKRRISVRCYSGNTEIYKSDSVSYVNRSAGRYLFFDNEDNTPKAGHIDTNSKCLFKTHIDLVKDSDLMCK
jgi:hypothetical protein